MKCLLEQTEEKNIVGEISPILMGWPRLLGKGIQPPLTEMYMANKIYI